MPPLSRSITSRTISSRSIAPSACLWRWPLALQTGSGAWKTLWPSGNPTSSGGRKERREPWVFQSLYSLRPSPIFLLRPRGLPVSSFVSQGHGSLNDGSLNAVVASCSIGRMQYYELLSR